MIIKCILELFPIMANFGTFINNDIGDTLIIMYKGENRYHFYNSRVKLELSPITHKRSNSCKKNNTRRTELSPFTIFLYYWTRKEEMYIVILFLKDMALDLI